jgi:excisionase family DNA binding protein
MTVLPDKKLSPAERHVRSLGGDFLMVSEVADVLNVSVSTVRKLITNEDLDAPSFFVKFGEKTQIYLYTQKDVEELRDYLDNYRRVLPTTQKPEKRIGRPPKYTEEERKAKRAEYNRKYYERRKAEKRAEENDEVRDESAGRGREQALYPEFKEG